MSTTGDFVGSDHNKGKNSTRPTVGIAPVAPGLPEGEMELILIYERKQASEQAIPLSLRSWPVLEGGRYLGGTLRREELYDDDGRR